MPINLNDIKTADDFDDGIPSQRQITTCRLDKPQPNEWFKLFNLGEGMKSFIPATITTQRDERGDHQKYLLTNTKDKNFVKKYAYDLRPSKQCRLAYGYTSTGIIFIWPVNFNPMYPDNAWHLSAARIAEGALEDWAQIKSNKPNGCYDYYTMPKSLAEKTKEPYEKIPKSYEWAIENAFKGRIVDSEDHLIIRNLGIKNDN